MLKGLKRVAMTIVLAAGLSAGGPALAAEQDVFDIFPIQVEGNIYGHIIGDFNGDNLKDVVLFYSPADNPDTRFAALCINNGPRAFAARPDYLMRLPQTAVQVDKCNVDADAAEEIVFLDADGVAFIDFDAATGLTDPRRLIRRNTVYAMPVFSGIIVEPFFVTFGEIEDKVAIIPTPQGYILYEKEEIGTYEILNQLTLPIFCYNPEKELKNFRASRQSSFSTELASVRANDCNKDGLTDLYFLWSHKICCFIQDSTGNFPANPDVNLSFFPENLDGFMQTWLDDLNGDDRLDAVVSFTSGGITNAETTLSFYLSGPDGKMSKSGKREIRLSDSHCNLIINDYNNDHQPELVVPALELGTIAATKMFLMKKADLHLLIYDLVGGIPEEEPRSRKKVEFHFNFDQPQPTREVSVDWSADFNNDNLRDLVFVDGGGNIKIYWGDYKDFLASRPDTEIMLDHPATVEPVQLENDGLCDMVVEHNLQGKFDRITILKNRGKGVRK